MGSQHGMSTLEQCLNDLYAKGLISQEEALGKASNPKTTVGGFFFSCFFIRLFLPYSTIIRTFLLLGLKLFLMPPL